MTSTAERKTDAINLRMSPSTKELLRLAAEREHRTLSNMLEVLIMEHASKVGLSLESRTTKPSAPKRAKPRSL